MNKRVISVIFFIILFISGFNIFLSVPATSFKIYNYNVAGFYIVTVSSIFYVYSVYTFKKSIGIISSIGLVCGFIACMLTLYTAYNNYDNITLNIGFYLLIIAYIIFLISLFISNYEEKDNTKDSLPIENSPIYIRGKYIYGINSGEQLSNHECVLSLKNELLNIIIAKDDKTVNYDIEIRNIKNVSVKKVMLMNQKNETVEDYTMANQVLSAALFGPYGGLVYQTGIFDDGGKDTKVSYTHIYEVEITYELNNENKRLMVQLYKNPDILFKEIKENE